MGQRKLFCQISPLTYSISLAVHRQERRLKNLFSSVKFASTVQKEPLPHLVYAHKSLIRRKLGNVSLQLQENKAVNLSITAPKISGLLVKQGETFSFFGRVGACKKAEGYKEGLVIRNGEEASGIGGGLCQFTNLIHWMILHTPLTITEHHHHDMFDLFPDFGRQVPFGCGTSILYNYLDYRFTNDTPTTFQLITYTTDTHLCGEIRSDQPMEMAYHMKVEDEFFSREEGVVYRNNRICRKVIDKHTGNIISNETLKRNHAKVMYDTSDLIIR